LGREGGRVPLLVLKNAARLRRVVLAIFMLLEVIADRLVFWWVVILEAIAGRVHTCGRWGAP
jgi:hypothetical protein